MTENNGGPAYPQMRVWNASLAEYEDTQQYPGMNLRDWFAGQVISSVKGWHPADRGGKSAAQIAYEIADEMLEIRQQVRRDYD